MDIKGFTLAKALRQKKTLAQVLATAVQRIARNIVVAENQKADFNTLEQLGVYRDAQADLRQLKTAVAQKSLSTKVQIPEGIPAPEAGQEIPVYQAVLVRDDLKGYRAQLQRLVDTPANDRGEYDRKSGDYVLIPVKRTFDFEATLKELEQLQDAIDEIDGAIQYADATVKF